MNTLLTNIRLIIPLSLLILFVSNGFSQPSFLKGTIRPYAYLSPEEPGMIIYKGMVIYKLGCNYGVADVIEIGAYIGTAGYKKKESEILSRDDFLYGINIKYHLTNLYAKNEFPMLELYLSGDVGGWTLNHESNIIPKGNTFDYGIYVGAAFYPTKNLGLMGEVGYGKNSKVRAGIISRF